MSTTEEMLRRAIALLEATNQRLDEIEERFGKLEERIEPEPQPEIVPQEEACEQLRVSRRTLLRKRSKWVEGVHWWKEDGSDRPLYNLPLIRDGQRQGFNSPAHLMECQRWVKAQSQLRRKAG